MNLSIHTDGSCYHKDGRMGIGIAFFLGDEDKPFQEFSTYVGMGTSNIAEYLAILNALLSLSVMSLDERVNRIELNSDSQLVINQINGDWICREPELNRTLFKIDTVLKAFPHTIHFQWVPRTHPRQQIVDKLSKLGNPYFSK